jgi:hypothetical protein
MQRNEGVTQNTREKESRVLKRWTEYANSVGFSQNIWLASLLPEQRTYIIAAFAAALRRREFSRPDDKDLAAATVQEAMAKLGEMFRTNVGYNPTHGGGSNTLHPLLTRQFRGMKNLDPGERQQKALPVLVYRELHKIASESSLLIDSTIAWLLTLAYFWCMRSWEYSDVQGERRTKLLCVRNFCFFDQYNRDISSEYNHLHLATTVAITFEFQKKDVRYDTISHQRSGDSLGNCEMCPVRAAQELILQLQQYRIPPEKFADTPINYVE